MIQFWSIQIHCKRKYLSHKKTGFLDFPSCYHWTLSTWTFSSRIFLSFFPNCCFLFSVIALSLFWSQNKDKNTKQPPTVLEVIRKKARKSKITKYTVIQGCCFSVKARPLFDEENGCCSSVYFSAVCGFHKQREVVCTTCIPTWSYSMAKEITMFSTTTMSPRTHWSLWCKSV